MLLRRLVDLRLYVLAMGLIWRCALSPSSLTTKLTLLISVLAFVKLHEPNAHFPAPSILPNFNSLGSTFGFEESAFAEGSGGVHL